VSGILEFYKSRAVRVGVIAPESDEPAAAEGPPRADPADGSVWAWPEFRARYEAEFGPEETAKYWKSMPVHRADKELYRYKSQDACVDGAVPDSDEPVTARWLRTGSDEPVIDGSASAGTSWSSLRAPLGPPPGLDEPVAAKGSARVDPADGSVWAWPEFQARYEAEFGLEATVKYWKSMPVRW